MRARMAQRPSFPLTLSNIAPDGFSRNRASGANVVGLGPQMVCAADLLEVGEVLAKITRGVAFEQVGNLRWAEAGWRGNADMDVVEVCFQGQKGQAMPLATLREQVLRGFL